MNVKIAIAALLALAGVLLVFGLTTIEPLPSQGDGGKTAATSTRAESSELAVLTDTEIGRTTMSPTSSSRPTGPRALGRSSSDTDLTRQLALAVDPRDRERLINEFAFSLVNLSEAEALARVAELPDAESRDIAMVALLGEWSGLSNLAIIRGGDIWRYGATGALANYLLETGRLSAGETAAMLLDSQDGSRRTQLLGRVAADLVTTDPAAALALGEGLVGRDQARFYREFVDRWADIDSSAVRDWAAGISDPNDRSRVLARVLESEAEVNPVTAAQNFQLMPPDTEQSRSRAARDIAEAWAAQDTMAAAQWAGGLTNEADRTAANQGIERAAPIGIGARVARGSDGVPILEDFVSGSPASTSGLQPGDRLLAVADASGSWVDSRGLRINQVSGMIRGEPNTQVTLQVQSPGAAAPRVVTLGRQQIIHRPQ